MNFNFCMLTPLSFEFSAPKWGPPCSVLPSRNRHLGVRELSPFEHVRKPEPVLCGFRSRNRHLIVHFWVSSSNSFQFLTQTSHKVISAWPRHTTQMIIQVGILASSELGTHPIGPLLLVGGSDPPPESVGTRPVDNIS